MGKILKIGILDAGSGNRLNGINYNEMELFPDCFVDETSGAELTSFAGYAIYTTTQCSGRIDDSGASRRLFVTPSTSDNTFSFCLTNTSGPLINGFAVEALSHNVSVKSVRFALGDASLKTIKQLCTSSLVNPNSPHRPSGSAPYMLGAFRGYTHNGAGGVNIYNPNGGEVAYNAYFDVYAAATRNQQSFNTVKIEVYKDAALLGYATKNISGSPFIEKQISSELSAPYYTTNSTIKVDVSFLNDSSEWELIDTNSNTRKFRGKPYFGYLNYLIVNSNPRKLEYEFVISNQLGSSQDIEVKITNTTTGYFTTITTTLAADTLNHTVTGLTTAMGANNAIGDSFTIQVKNNAGSYIDVDTTGSLTLNYGA